MQFGSELAIDVRPDQGLKRVCNLGVFIVAALGAFFGRYPFAFEGDGATGFIDRDAAQAESAIEGGHAGAAVGGTECDPWLSSYACR